jgi:hypothetical protein
MKTHKTPITLAVNILNERVGKTLWYTEFRFLFVRAGGDRKECAETLEKLVAAFPKCLAWRSRIGHGRMVTCDVEVLREIDVC